MADPNVSVKDKAAAAATTAATAAISAVASPVVGKVAGKVLQSKSGKKLLAVVSAIAFALVLAMMVNVASVVQAASMLVLASAEEANSGTGAETDGCPVLNSATGTDASLKADQQANALTIINTVTGRGLGADDAAIAVMTSLTESGLVNVDHGDLAGPDSRGLFQQRDSWGSLEDRMDPARAAGLFLDRLVAPGLKLYKNRSVSINATATSRTAYEPWMAAQSVQSSGFPTGANYLKQYVRAVSIVTNLLGTAPPSAQKWADSASLTLAPTGTAVNAGTGVGASTGSAISTGGCAVGVDVALMELAKGLIGSGGVVVQIGKLTYLANLNGAVVVSTGGDGVTVVPLADIGGPDVLKVGDYDGTGTPNVAAPGAWGGFTNGNIPETELAPLPWVPTQPLERNAAASFTALNVAYRARFGVDISVTDGYRNYDQQVATKAAKGNLAAKPGTSNHGWGKAVDLGGGINNWGTTQRNWMVEHAPSYGWVSPKWANPGGQKLEAWHWEFNDIVRQGQ